MSKNLLAKLYCLCFILVTLDLNEGAVFYYRDLKPEITSENFEVKDPVEWVPWTWLSMVQDNVPEINVESEPQEKLDLQNLPICQSRFEFFYGTCQPRRIYI